jgi:hypothetical protein
VHDLPGVMAYQESVAQAKAEVANALASLDKVNAQAAAAPAGVVEDFSAEVGRLEVNSTQIRARVQAIQARGDAYFNDWSNSISKIKNSRVRELAELHHADLEQSFLRIKAGSQRAGAAFKPFLAGMRTLRVRLELQPSVITEAPVRNLISVTFAQGRQTIEELEGVNFELQGVVAMLTPPKK